MEGKVVIVGGGIIGLSSAFYLQKSGWYVTVIDKGNFKENCSYGNAGYVSPSHFVPLASPGIVKQALKWMFNSKSPFYVKPRLNLPLIKWGLQFMRSATTEHVKNAAVPLRDIGLLSLKEYEEWRKLPEFNFYFEKKGILDLFQTEEKMHHAHEVEKGAQELGLDAVLLNKEEVAALEPGTRMNVLGGLHWKCDAHCYPNDLMKNLIGYLEKNKVKMIAHEEVRSFEKNGNKIATVVTDKNRYNTDAVVIATGSWSREVSAFAGANIPLMPGRGYSVTIPDDQFKTNYPAILVEGRVAITPMDGRMRLGGTMEITPTGTPPRLNRVQGIMEAVKRFFPDFNVPMPTIDQIWYGYRPCSADGLPYIGRLKKNNNVILATGHAMVGLTFGAGTGKLVSEMLNEQQLSMDVSAFAPERFS